MLSTNLQQDNSRINSEHSKMRDVSKKEGGGEIGMAVAYTACSAASINYVLYIFSYSVYNFSFQILSNILGICVQL